MRWCAFRYVINRIRYDVRKELRAHNPNQLAITTKKLKARPKAEALLTSEARKG